jgi:hypothetical protein
MSDLNPMQPGQPMRRPGGAIWCDQPKHQRWECVHNVKKTRGGGRCHGPAIGGTDACRMHAGQRAEVARAKGEAVTAWSALSGKATISNTEAVMGMLQMSWLRVHLYAGLLEQQVREAQGDASGDDGEDLEVPGGKGERGAGLIGKTLSASPGIGVYATGEAVRGLALLEAQERDRCVRFAKTAHDMGIADQQIRLAEQQGAMLAGVISRVLDRLGLSEEQRRLVGTVVPEELRAAQAVEGAA